MKNLKPGGGGKPQPYVPKGNGEKSGEYTNKNEVTQRDDNILSVAELLDFLSPNELKDLQLYTNYRVGTILNKMIREGRINEFAKNLSNSIANSIAKSRVKNEIVLYRGIHIPLNVFENNFITPYLKNKVITGSLICSTSRNIERAIYASVNTKNEIPVVFEITVPKNGHALSIESISLDADEQEYLLTSPKYIITDLRAQSNNNNKYIKIYAKILED